MADTNLQVKIGLDDNISSGLKKIEGNFGDFNNQIGKTVSSAVKNIAKIGAVIGGTATLVGGLLLNSASNVQNMQVALKTAFQGSKEEADKAYKTISEFAAKTPYQMKEVMTSFIKLKNLGLDPSNKALEAYGNTASSMGKSLDQMIEAVADASTGEFERLKEFGIRSSKEGDNIKFTFQGVTTTVKNNSKDIENYLIKLGETKFSGGMEAQSQTLAGKISTLKDDIGIAFNDIAVKSGLLDFATKAVGNMSDVIKNFNFDTIKNGLKGLRTLIFEGDFKGSDNLFGMGEDSGFLTFVLDARKAVILFFEALKTNQHLIGFVSGAIDVFKKIITPAIPTIIAFAGILLYLGTQVLSALQYAWQELKAPILQVMDAILTFWKAVQPAIIAFANIFTILVVPVLQSMFAIAVQIFKGLLLVISGTLNMIAGIFNNVFGIIIGLFTGDFSRAKESFQNGIKGLGQFLGGLWTIIGAPFKGVFDGIQNMLRGIDFFAIAVNWMQNLIRGIQSKVSGVGEVIKNSIGSGVSNLFGRKAIGGIATGGQYLVGETGPEMVTLPQGSRVSRSSETKDMMQSKDKGIIQNNYITMNNSVDWEIGTSILARKLRLS